MSQPIVRPLWQLHRADPEELMQTYAGRTQARFEKWRQSGRAVPVIIPSRNEEHDIVGCLIALARSSRPVLPIVVVNCSDDRTFERAERMGAMVTDIKSGVRKMGATQRGVELATAYLDDNNVKRRVVLFTDADTLVPRRWAAILSRRLRRSLRHDPLHGAGVFGSSVFLHGPSRLADFAQSAHGFYLDIWQAVKRGTPLVRGHTYGLGLDLNDIVVKALNSLDPETMYRDDVTIYETLKGVGVPISRCLNPRAIVITRGDRAHSFKEFMENLYKPGYEGSTYDKQYTVCPPAPTKKARRKFSRSARPAVK